MEPAVAARCRSCCSLIMMSPLALVGARNTPWPGTYDMRSPSLPWLASSVTSKRSIGHARRAATSLAPVPGEPVQATSARYEPCAAGWSAHDRDTGAPTTRSSAHSTCWQSAFGQACTKTTPWVDRRCTRHLHRIDWSRLPLRTCRFGDALYSALTEQGSGEQFARWRAHRASPVGSVGANVTDGHLGRVLPLVKRLYHDHRHVVQPAWRVVGRHARGRDGGSPEWFSCVSSISSEITECNRDGGDEEPRRGGTQNASAVTRSPPLVFDRYMAASARCSRSSTSSPGSTSATPTLAVTPSAPPTCATAARSRSAIISPEELTETSARTANSSPPSRATVSVSRTAPPSAMPTALSMASPAACPPASLTLLNPSRSTRQTTDRCPEAASSTAPVTRSMKARRLGMPVSGSVEASVSCVRMSMTWRS